MDDLLEGFLGQDLRWQLFEEIFQLAYVTIGVLLWHTAIVFVGQARLEVLLAKVCECHQELILTIVKYEEYKCIKALLKLVMVCRV